MRDGLQHRFYLFFLFDLWVRVRVRVTIRIRVRVRMYSIVVLPLHVLVLLLTLLDGCSAIDPISVSFGRGWVVRPAFS